MSSHEQNNLHEEQQNSNFTISDFIRCVTLIVRRQRHLGRVLVDEYIEDKFIRFKIFTAYHSYTISAEDNERGGYIGYMMGNRMPDPGESHTRGCGGWEGRLNYETWVEVLADILNHEILNIEYAPWVIIKDYPDGPPRVFFEEIAMKHARDIVVFY